MQLEQEIRSTNIEMYVWGRVVPQVSLVHATCIRYQIILHESDVASISSVVNADFACYAGFGSSLPTSKA